MIKNHLELLFIARDLHDAEGPREWLSSVSVTPGLLKVIVTIKDDDGQSVFIFTDALKSR